MAGLSITHAKVSAVTDGTDSGKVRPSDWNNTHTLAAINASRLIGRGDSGPGTPEEITLGTNLSMSGATLNAGNTATVSAASRLIGRGSSGAGDEEEITLATGLTMVGTVLTPAVGSISASSLVGRRSTSAGANEEITLGSGLSMSGATLSATSAGGVSVFDQTATDATVGNTAVETTIYSKSITGGTLGTIGKLRLTLYLRAESHLAASTTYTLRYKYGATTLITVTGIGAGDGAYVDNFVHFDLMGDTATSAQLGYAEHQANMTRGTSAEDSTAAKTLAVTLQWSAAGGATQSAVMEHATLEQVK